MSSGATYLDGVRVLDLSRVLAGPLATLILADLGAEVLKVEPPDGDVTRGWGPPFVGAGSSEEAADAAYFHAVNRDKISLVLDLRSAGDRARLAELAAVADVVVHNYPPAMARRLGVEATLAEAARRAVVLGVTGYRAARREEAGYDLVLQAEAGWMAITGPAEGEPHRVGVAVVDVLTGMMAATGVLGALFHRERHGGGASLGVSLFQTALWSLINVVQGHLATGRPSTRHGNRHPNITPYELFHCADGSMVVGVGTDAQYERLCELLGIVDPALRGLDNAARVARREAVAAAVASGLAGRRRDAAVAELRAARIPAAPVLRPDEAVAAARGFDPGALLALDHRTLGRLEYLASPLEGAGIRRDHRPPPGHGEGGAAVAERWLGAGAPSAQKTARS